jgi:hypothetical protein
MKQKYLPSVLCFFLMFLCLAVRAGIEVTEGALKGDLLKVNSVLTVEDVKIHSSLFVWSNIVNISTNNTITLSVLEDHRDLKDFACNIKLRVEYYDNPSLENVQVIDTVSLNVNYDSGFGKSYKSSDKFNFKNGYHVRVTILQISNPDFVRYLQLSSSIVINRKYRFLNGQSPSVSN